MTDNNRKIIEVIRELLNSNTIGTQEEIKHVLEQQGFEINQSKISRLLRRLGAVKITNEHKNIIYSLPRDPAPTSAKNILTQLITQIMTNETLVILRTHPGCASLIARLLDHHQDELFILGTVAGDDTIFVAPKKMKYLQKTHQAIQGFLANLS